VRSSAWPRPSRSRGVRVGTCDACGGGKRTNASASFDVVGLSVNPRFEPPEGGGEGEPVDVENVGDRGDIVDSREYEESE